MTEFSFVEMLKLPINELNDHITAIENEKMILEKEREPTEVKLNQLDLQHAGKRGRKQMNIMKLKQMMTNLKDK